jgi:hypothetical protein
VVEIEDKNKEKVLLCKLKNPILSDNNWKGDWSDESDLWTKEINKQIKEDILETKKNEFFINIQDLLKYFYRTDICNIAFNEYSKSFNFTEENTNLDEPQILNFYLNNKGNVSFLVSENNWKFHKELRHYSHPTSLIIVEYNPKKINDIKNIFTYFESDKDIESTLTLNEGFYFLWIFKYFLNEEEDKNKNKNMNIKILSKNKFSIKHLGPDNDFQIIQQIIYEQIKQEKEKEKLIKDSEVFHYITNEFKNSGLAYRIAINPLSKIYQRWDVNPSGTNDFTIISPKLNPKEPFTVNLEINNYIMILAIRNKKYGQFTFNTEVDVEEFDTNSKNEKNNEKNLTNFQNFFVGDKNKLDPVTTKETGSLEDISKKEVYPTVDHDKIFFDKYKNKSKLLETLLEMEKDENNNNKKLRWVKIKKENGVYLGEAEQNLPQGRGCFIYKGSEKGETLQWIGYFDNGEKTKFGKLYNDEGRLIYEGEYKNGIRNGEGTYYYNRGLKYEGQFLNGLREGQGIFYWEDGTRWEGPFKNNEMHGKGVYYNKEESFPVSYNYGEIIE